MLYIRIDIHHLCLASIAKFSDGRLEKNFEEMVGTTREAAAVATESGGTKNGDETEDETGGPGGPGDETGDDGWGNVYGRRGVRI